MTITLKEAAALRAVGMGADVFSYGIAIKLRSVEKKHPEYVKITKAINKKRDRKGYSQPYFGAFATAAGRRVAASMPKACVECGCTEDDCSTCVEKSGAPCSWFNEFICTTCAGVRA